MGLSACGGSASPPVASAPKPKPPAAPAPQKGTLPEGMLKRADVDAVIDKGFGYFLQTLEVEPALESGRFRGWMIVELRPVPLWSRVDLRAGDVVRSVNGMPIERDTEAYDAFQSLRSSEELVVAYARDGAERRLSYRIVP
jgi:type II secretory pathway component PulC